jgi:hypothetical protein
MHPGTFHTALPEKLRIGSPFRMALIVGEEMKKSGKEPSDGRGSGERTCKTYGNTVH